MAENSDCRDHAVFGHFDPDVEAGSVVPKVVLGSLSGGGSETDVFAATKKSLAHREQPGVLMIDVDSKDPHR